MIFYQKYVLTGDPQKQRQIRHPPCSRMVTMSARPRRYSKGFTFFGHHFFLWRIGVPQVVRGLTSACNILVRGCLSDFRLDYASSRRKTTSDFRWGGSDMGGSGAWRHFGGMRRGICFLTSRFSTVFRC